MEDYRERFKALLESTYVPSNGSEEAVVNGMMSFLEKVIEIIPEKLYRYRRIDEDGRTIKSFENGIIPLCTAKCFSDKYDSLIYVDSDRMREETKKHFLAAAMSIIEDVKRRNPLVRPDKASRLCYLLEQGMTEREVAEKIVKEDYTGYINEYGKKLKQWESHFRECEKTARIACFTESVQSMFMWDTYAGGYQGFVLEYNLRDFLINCLKKKVTACVFPVIYTDERPNLTKEIADLFTIFKAHEEGWLNQLMPFAPFFDTNLLSPYKPFLYKDREEYGHEKEWRILYYKENCREDYVEMSDEGCLKAIYYGVDIKEGDYKKLHQIALKKGIKEYRVSIDNNSRKYSLQVNPL